MSALMYPKPEKSKKNHNGLQQKTPLKVKTRLKNKGSKHKNKRVKNNTPCEFNFPGCLGIATDNHELKSGASHRTNSSIYGFQVQVCRSCHRYWEDKLSKHEKNHIRASKQIEVMIKHNWSIEDFIKFIGQNYL